LGGLFLRGFFRFFFFFVCFCASLAFFSLLSETAVVWVCVTTLEGAAMVLVFFCPQQILWGVWVLGCSGMGWGVCGTSKGIGSKMGVVLRTFMAVVFCSWWFKCGCFAVILDFVSEKGGSLKVIAWYLSFWNCLGRAESVFRLFRWL